PWPTLTLVVSLEAIFLSTFVMIAQNRQSEFQQAKADHDFEAQELELKTNTQLTRQIHVLTVELHRRLLNQTASDSPGPGAASSDGDAPPAQGTVGRGRWSYTGDLRTLVAGSRRCGASAMVDPVRSAVRESISRIVAASIRQSWGGRAGQL